jgi:hypothetical protein
MTAHAGEAEDVAHDASVNVSTERALRARRRWSTVLAPAIRWAGAPDLGQDNSSQGQTARSAFDAATD